MAPELLHVVRMPESWIVVGATALMVALAVGLHDAVLDRLNRAFAPWHPPARVRMMVLILLILAAHTAEVWIFGLGTWLVAQVPGTGSIEGADPLTLLDAVYLSAVSFTTVGYGDLAPQGHLRLIMGTEALTGLVLITWSASFTFLEMQRYWRVR